MGQLAAEKTPKSYTALNIIEEPEKEFAISTVLIRKEDWKTPKTEDVYTYYLCLTLLLEQHLKPLRC